MEPHPGQPTDELLIRFLSERSPNCPVCKYSLTGLTSPRCPECGTKLRLTLEGDTLPMREWIVGVIGAALAVGSSLIFWIGMILSWVMGGVDRPPTGYMLLMGAGGVLSMSTLLWWCSRQTGIRRWPGYGRLLGAFGCWLVMAVPHLLGLWLFL